MNIFYTYKIVYYYDVDEPKTVSGITYGNSWTEAMHNLIQTYGDDQIVEIHSFNIIGDGGPCIEFDELKKEVNNL